jgi:hypothetical protein
METSKGRQEGTMDMRVMMEEYIKRGTPGAPHEMLAGLAGSWVAAVKTWMDATKEPLESIGTCEQKMILGGRFLRQEFSGNMMGIPYNGIGYTGYDNHTKKYVSTWMDSGNTAIISFAGSGSTDGKTFTQESGYYDDPVRGPRKWRSVTKVVDHNTVLFEMDSVDKNNKAERMMEVTYTRK